MPAHLRQKRVLYGLAAIFKLLLIFLFNTLSHMHNSLQVTSDFNKLSDHMISIMTLLKKKKKKCWNHILCILFIQWLDTFLIYQAVCSQMAQYSPIQTIQNNNKNNYSVSFLFLPWHLNYYQCCNFPSQHYSTNNMRLKL